MYIWLMKSGLPKPTFINFVDDMMNPVVRLTDEPDELASQCVGSHITSVLTLLFAVDSVSVS